MLKTAEQIADEVLYKLAERSTLAKGIDAAMTPVPLPNMAYKAMTGKTLGQTLAGSKPKTAVPTKTPPAPKRPMGIVRPNITPVE